MTNQPLLEVFTTSWNEPETVERLILWYRHRVPGCLISVCENTNTWAQTKTTDLVSKYSIKLGMFDTKEKMDEDHLIWIRNTIWKGSTAKFVIVCDSDELVDVTEQDLLACNDGEEWNLCKCHGVELFGHEAADGGRFFGVDADGYSKSVLFHRASVESMNFAAGSHTCSPTMNMGYLPKWNPAQINLYHTKWQDWDRGLARQHQIRDRGVSEQSVRNGWNFHYSLPDFAHEEYFRNGYEKRKLYDTL